MYRSGELQREFGMHSGPYTGGVLRVTPASLSASTRQRLSEALLGEGSAAPIAAECSPRASRSLQLVCTAGSALALFVLVSWGFGILADPSAIQPWSFLWGYAVLGTTLVVSARSLLGSVRKEGWVPLPVGRYLLPFDLVEIERGIVSFRPFGDARHVRVDDERGTVRILYADGACSILRARSAGGPSVWVRLLAAQHEVEEATQASPCTPIASDPLAELRDASGWVRIGPQAGLERHDAKASPSSRIGAWACAAACLCGPPLMLALRNRASDDAMFAQATSAAGYELYLHAGGTRHANVVRGSLLPRAALDEAERPGDLRSMRAFLAEFPASPFDAEARLRLHDACLSELDQERALDAIANFEVRHADCHVGDVVQERLRATYESILSDATSRGLQGVRNYIRSFPSSPNHDRAVASLAELYQGERRKIEDGVQRMPLRETLLSMTNRSQRDDVPTELYVPVTVADDLDMTPALVRGRDVTRGVLAGFDTTFRGVLDGAVVNVYHPTNIAPADVARAHSLRVLISPAEGDDDLDAVLVRYELATGDKIVAKWTHAVRQNAIPERFGDDLARGAMTP